jgi:S1-C subfamily serine protease
MSETVKRLVPRAWWLAIVGTLALSGLAFRSAQSEGEGGRPPAVAQAPVVGRTTVSPLVTHSAGSDFLSPQELSRQFCDRLGEIMRERPLPSPWELVDQLKGERLAPIVPRQDAGRKLTSEQIYASARKSVVVIGGISPRRRSSQWSGSYATGFVIRADGIVVTNAHVIEAFVDSKAIAVMTDDGRVFPVVSVLAADRRNDVAVVKVDAEDLYPLPIARDINVGATVYCLSHPALDCAGRENAFYTFTQGIVSAKLRLPIESDEPINALAITADYAQGSSGGPILNENGAVVGMVCHTLSLCAGDAGSPQMTWKMARPAGSILGLLSDRPSVYSASTR